MQALTKYRIFAGFYALCLLVQGIGGYFTQVSVSSWYPALNKSELTPPGATFGIAWTLLYFLMACAATRVALRARSLHIRALRLWLVQLLLGLLWCIIFFGQRHITGGLLIIIINWLAVAATLDFFRRIDKPAAWLLAPLLGWLAFATYLNYYIFVHN